MGFHGILSKGCDLCRKRKVRCDQRRPLCLRCERLRIACPGYRDLNDLTFRDESTRIIGNAKRLRCKATVTDRAASSLSQLPSSEPDCTIAELDLGAKVCFEMFIGDDRFLGQDNRTLLLRRYENSPRDMPLRAVIEAVGLAAISNTSHGPDLHVAANRQYRRAMESVRNAAQSFPSAITDDLLMTAILLWLYQSVTGRPYDPILLAATSKLLLARGPDQFEQRYSVSLYLQARRQILATCMEHFLPIPADVVLATCWFEDSAIRKSMEQKEIASRGSIAEISFRLVNLRAAVRSLEVSDSHLIMKAALDIENDLRIWEQGSPAAWRYSSMHDVNKTDDRQFDHTCHLYPSVWIAEAWNNWRVMRIIANQLLWDHIGINDDERDDKRDAFKSVVEQMSRDICRSVHSFGDSPSKLCLIGQLFACTLSPIMVDHEIRSFAIKQLRAIGKEKGVRQASYLADAASGCLEA